MASTRLAIVACGGIILGAFVWVRAVGVALDIFVALGALVFVITVDMRIFGVGDIVFRC